MSVGWGGEVGVFICEHGHRAKTWRTVGQNVASVGQNVTEVGLKSDVQEKNATLECYNCRPTFVLSKHVLLQRYLIW